MMKNKATSSRIQVQSLAKDEEINPRKEKEEEKRQLWDSPLLPQQQSWIRDPRLPKEVNELSSSMRTTNQRRTFEMEHYRSPRKSEVSRPRDFSSYIRDVQQEKKRGTEKPPLKLPTIGESMASIDALKRKYAMPAANPNNPSHKDKGKTVELSNEEKERLRRQWYDEFQEILQGTKEELPPLREVNHEINLIDPDRRYTYHLPRCPVALREEFHAKINKYVNAGWWEPKTATQAAPLMCIPKKDGRLRTVIDARQRNENTVKDVTPLPDQEMIREDVARAPIRSKIDLADAYEQVRIRPGDVSKSAFATVVGTYVSNVVQQGDCNAPATFQRLMTSIFRDTLGKFLHVYLDDIFIFSNTVEEHEKHLRVVFERLRDNQLYMKWSKCNLYAEEIDCLGHIIDNKGIHPDVDKLSRIRDWRTPRNYNDIQRFVGLVNYVGNFLPNVTTYTGPLQAMTQNGSPFFWRPIHQRCFEMIKRICYKTPIIKPIDYKSDDPIWLICDASKTGVGAMYGQGTDWTNCRPAGFMSKKFTYAQQHYAVHEMETLAILEALMKWEDKLVGRKIHVITDHKALEFFKTQSQLSNRQRRWIDYMSRFQFDITYVRGEYNKVADCLSRYYESDTAADVHDASEYVQVDRKVDPEGEDLPQGRMQEIKERVVEIRAMQAIELRRSKRLNEIKEQRDIEAEELRQEEDPPGTPKDADKDGRNQPRDITLGDSLGNHSHDNERPLRNERSDELILAEIKEGYTNDKLFRLVIEDAQHHQTFTVTNGIIWKKNLQETDVICVPRNRDLITTILTQAHEIMGHYGDQRTCEYTRRWYWWPNMTKDAREFCRTCEQCQRAKGSNKKPSGKLHTLPVPIKPWDSIGMDFIGPFPEVKGLNYLWVVICRMTSMVHMIPVNTKMTATELSWKYIREIVRLHGLPSSIVSDRDSKFTSKWWTSLHKILGARLLMSTSFHPQTDGQTERANRNIGQIFRAIVQPDQRDWLEKVDMAEFAINSSVSATTGYAPFELNGGHMPSMIKELRREEIVAKGIKDFAITALQNIADAHDAIIEARTFQTYNANKKREEDPQINKDDLVYVATKNLNLPKGRARKLWPKYVGPYKVAEARPLTSTYVVELPTALQQRRINPTFHVSLLRPYQASNDTLFPNRTRPEPYDFGAPDDNEWFVDEILGHRWVKPNGVEYQVRWSLGDTTWEPHTSCNKLAALDRYLEIQGVKKYTQLPKR